VCASIVSPGRSKITLSFGAIPVKSNLKFLKASFASFAFTASTPQTSSVWALFQIL